MLQCAELKLENWPHLSRNPVRWAARYRRRSLVVVYLLCFDKKIFLKFVRYYFYFYSFLISGDRIISVNGESVSGKSYAEVVILIQRLRDNLSLIVVPKQDDILQMVKLLFICQFIVSIVQFSIQNVIILAVSATFGHFLV